MDKLILFTVLIVSIVIHEVAHGRVAYHFGDSTAKNLGRLTLNPIAHVDIVGSLLLPILCVVSHSPFFFGWAKPVPIDTRYFKNPLEDMMWVALAGPLSNLTLALVASITKLFVVGGVLSLVCEAFIVINIVLAVFNLMPIPPLDGSRILIRFLPVSLQEMMLKIEPYGFFIVLVAIYLDVTSFWLHLFFPLLYDFLLF